MAMNSHEQDICFPDPLKPLLSRNDYHLQAAGKELKDPTSVALDADGFFFNDDCTRKILSLDDTVLAVAELMEQGLYRDYMESRGIYTIPTIEFVAGIGEVIRQLRPSSVMEAGAGDGLLSDALRLNENIPVTSIDDFSYGYKVRNELNPIADRPVSKNVERIPLADALIKYNPDLVIASWLVISSINEGDDVAILKHPSVKYFLWIGEQNDFSTSSEDLWYHPGWKEHTLPHLNQLIFGCNDGSNRNQHSRFFQTFSPDETPATMQQKMRQEAKMILFIRD